VSEIVGEHGRGAALVGMALDAVPARCAGVRSTSQQAGAIAQVHVLSP